MFQTIKSFICNGSRDTDYEIKKTFTGYSFISCFLIHPNHQYVAWNIQFDCFTLARLYLHTFESDKLYLRQWWNTWFGPCNVYLYHLQVKASQWFSHINVTFLKCFIFPKVSADVFLSNWNCLLLKRHCYRKLYITSSAAREPTFLTITVTLKDFVESTDFGSMFTLSYWNWV